VGDAQAIPAGRAGGFLMFNDYHHILLGTYAIFSQVILFLFIQFILPSHVEPPSMCGIIHCLHYIRIVNNCQYPFEGKLLNLTFKEIVKITFYNITGNDTSFGLFQYPSRAGA
jgi:hypothetical protein